MRLVHRWRTVLSLSVAALTGCDCDGSDPCAGIDCSGHGACRVVPGTSDPYCACNPGFHPVGGWRECAANDDEYPCAGVSCSGHGVCREEVGGPICDCFPGFVADETGLYCFPEDPADGGGDREDGTGADGAPGEGAGGDADADDDGATGVWWTDERVREPGLTKLDMLVLVDNSGSMSQEQAALTLRFPELLTELLEPSDRNGDGRPDHVPVEDLHVGVISTDMGTMGYPFPTCGDRFAGDAACMLHAPEAEGCDGRSWPVWLSRDPANAAEYSPEDMAADFTCLGTLGTAGCGFEQPFKAMRQAVTVHALPRRVQRQVPSPGFLLPHVRHRREDCWFGPTIPRCSTRSMWLEHANIRCFLHPEYVEPVAEYMDAFRAMRPGGSNVFLAMIVGVPPDAEECIGFGDRLAGCLGVPAMREALDPVWSTQLIPSCDTSMGMAFPPRRFVELAQSWGKNAYVDSICKTDWREPLLAFARRLVEELSNDYFCLRERPSFDGATCRPVLAGRDAGRRPQWADLPTGWCPRRRPGR